MARGISAHSSVGYAAYLPASLTTNLRFVPILGKALKSSNSPLNTNLHPGLRSVLAVRAKKEPTGGCRLWFIMDFWMKREAFLKR